MSLNRQFDQRRLSYILQKITSGKMAFSPGWEGSLVPVSQPVLPLVPVCHEPGLKTLRVGAIVRWGLNDL